MDQTPDNPQPVRQSRWRFLITPWRWNRRTWIAMLIALPPVYFMSAVPVTRIVSPRFVSTEIALVAWDFYWPVWISRGNSETLRDVLQWEDEMMDEILGPDGGIGGMM